MKHKKYRFSSGDIIDISVKNMYGKKLYSTKNTPINVAAPKIIEILTKVFNFEIDNDFADFIEKKCGKNGGKRK